MATSIEASSLQHGSNLNHGNFRFVCQIEANHLVSSALEFLGRLQSKTDAACGIGDRHSTCCFRMYCRENPGIAGPHSGSEVCFIMCSEVQHDSYTISPTSRVQEVLLAWGTGSQEPIIRAEQGNNLVGLHQAMHLVPGKPYHCFLGTECTHIIEQAQKAWGNTGTMRRQAWSAAIDKLRKLKISTLTFESVSIDQTALKFRSVEVRHETSH